MPEHFIKRIGIMYALVIYTYRYIHWCIRVHVELLLVLRQFKSFITQNPQLSYLFIQKQQNIKLLIFLCVFLQLYQHIPYHTIPQEH